ncbi:MAG: aldehyde ferredoxin oxidoreductase family protein [Candidatus Bathyarchaeia archaeon]|nr:aldehyde ferredoxin oxidoreductase family protein [Candidatus Bathyarchaeota archaeon]
MPGGYMGKILRVDLSTGALRTEPILEEVARKYLGGKGYAVYILYNYLREYEFKGISPPDINPLGPENVLIFATGPGTGIPGFPCSGRYHVMALRSPLTGSIGSANSGGEWGPFLKFSGYDMIVIEGASEEPVYLSIVNGVAELRSAGDLWGKNVFDTCRILSRRVGGKNTSVACIGPAGENLVRMACIVNDEHRAAGRTGLGAVMGSKKLKAIVVSGDEKVPVANPDEFREVSRRCLETMRKNRVTGEGLPTYGTSILINVINTAGGLPYKNWQTGVNPYADKISGETLAETYLTGRRACWGCTIGCGRVTSVPSGPFQIIGTEGPEYESIWALGGSTGVKDLDAIVKANHYCDEFGMDPISLGSTIAAAMELYERGYIPKEDLQGLDLRFGNSTALVEAVWRTAYRVGFGKYLALGSKKLCEIYGHPEISMSVKGLEMPAYDPRAMKGIGLEYATANRGGCHVTGYTVSVEILGIPEKIDPLTPEGKAKWAKLFQDFACVVNSTVNCLFSTFALGVKDYADLLSAVTGWSLSEDEILRIGERIYNLERVIINRLGFDGKDDTLPRRLLEEPMPEGPAKGHIVELERMKEEYYRLRGWVNGIPTAEKLKELEIEL